MNKAISIYRAIDKVMGTPDTKDKSKLGKSTKTPKTTDTYKIYHFVNKEPNELLIKIRAIFETITKSHYKNWLARKKWTIFEASCLFNGLDQSAFEELSKTFATDKPSDSEMLGPELDIISETISLMSDIRREAQIMLTWLPKQDRGKPEDNVTEPGIKAEEDSLKLINMYLITLGSIPKEMLVHAKKAFLRLYQSKDTNEDTRKNWQDNWHTIAPPFKALIDKSTKIKKDISPRKEETLLSLIGILIDKYYNGNKYKKPDGLHKNSTITEEIIDYVSKQLPCDNIPHGLKKSNLTEIISNSLECWKKKKGK